jgi:hypothetical protein
MMFKVGITILAFLAVAFLTAIPIGYAFIGDWDGHWVVATIFALADIGLICITQKDFFQMWREK